MLLAIRDNEDAARAAGKNILRFRLEAFVLGSTIMGVAGGLYAAFFGFISPEAFDPMFATFLVWVMLIAGGSGNNRGALVGCLAVWLIWSATEVLTTRLPAEYVAQAAALRVLLVGLLLVVVAIIALLLAGNLFCMGCHSSVGATIDKTFGFPRKVDGAAGWGYIDLKGMPDAPNKGETMGEIAQYLSRVGGGGEFRSNPEMFQRWFNEDGTVDHERLARAEDVYDLIVPSRERALKLNKAYRVIVEDQDYIFGRDAITEPPANVYQHIDNETAPTLPGDLFFEWDIRLDWSARNDAADN